MKSKIDPISPAEILLEEFLKPANINASKLAKDINVPVNRITQILNNSRSITPDTALRLSIYFNTSPEFWMNLQTYHDLECAKNIHMAELKAGIKPFHPA